MERKKILLKCEFSKTKKKTQNNVVKRKDENKRQNCLIIKMSLV